MNVYFDNAASSPLLPEVLEAMMPYFQQHYGNPSAIHSWGRLARTAIERSRKSIANYLHASTAEIYFTSCGTESNNMVLQTAVWHHNVKRIVTSLAEHPCIIKTAEFLLQTGTEVVFLKPDITGRVDINELDHVLGSKKMKTLVTLMHVNNELGSIMSLHAISAVCKKHDALFHSDTTQSIGWYPINVQELAVDFLSASAHKFHGPKGVGFLYCRTNTLSGPLLFGGAQERNLRAGTENVAGIVGMARALELSVQHMQTRKMHILSLREYMKLEVQKRFPQAVIQGPEDADNVSYRILNIRFPLNQRSSLLIYNLDIAGIAASGGSACSSGTLQISHVLRAIGMADDQVAVRFSFSFLNTLEEVDYTIEALAKLIC